LPEQHRLDEADGRGFEPVANVEIPVASRTLPVVLGDGPKAWGWAAAAGALWGLSYFL
jgi:hypothetical protein